MISIERAKEWALRLKDSASSDPATGEEACDYDDVQAVVVEIERAIADAYRQEARSA